MTGRMVIAVPLVIAALGRLAAAQSNEASTAFEGYTRGIGDLISANGLTNAANSQANVNNQTAQSMVIDNRMLWTYTYHQMRRVNDAARSEEAGVRATAEDWLLLSHSRGPKRLNSVALDPISGQITWPPVLTTEPFAAFRTQIEAYFENRARTGAVALHSEVLRVQSITDEMLDELKKHIREIPSRDYLIARNFIESLGNEARFAAQ